MQRETVGEKHLEDRLPAALAIAEAMPDEAMFGLDPQILAAKAMVFDFAGKTVEAADAAARALPLMEAFEDTAALGVDIGDLRRRLQALAGRAD